MVQSEVSPYSHTLIDAGIDWITATQEPGDGAYKFEQVGDDLLDEQKRAGRTVRPALLRDYTGWRGEHLFVGTRDADAIIVASADVAAAHWQRVAQAARNVSRLDVQASVWTHGEQPSLARYAYAKLKRAPPARGRPRSFTLIRTHPYGETLNVGKRQSDQCGRVYDWSTAHKQGTAATVWRYEVELKRREAHRVSSALLAHDAPREAAASHVHRWFSTRHVLPPFDVSGCRLPNESAMLCLDRDPLSWFEQSVSKTVRKMIKLHGLPRVIVALGLFDMVEPRKEETRTDGSKPVGPLPHNADRRASRPSNPDGVSLSDLIKLRTE